MTEEEISERTEEAIKRIRKNPDVVRPSIGLFAGIYNDNGQLLLKRRSSCETLPGDWDLPGGAVKTEAADIALDERLIGMELAREVEEETGIKVSVDLMPTMYPAIIKGGFDWAFIIPITKEDSIQISNIDNWDKANKEGLKVVSPKELLELANGPEGNRLVSGVGKRMHRLALMALCHSPNEKYRMEAEKMLENIQHEFK
ncbi:NUDIX domain-containing protein [Candidatus Parcubacteria bacterium]|nr:NUDIX domain-containing protein [Candidatus Parcubacteria bacterium]